MAPLLLMRVLDFFLRSQAVTLHISGYPLSLLIGETGKSFSVTFELRWNLPRGICSRCSFRGNLRGKLASTPGAFFL